MQGMNVKINQLDEEVNERNADLKENDQLVDKHHKSHVKRVSVGSQTKHVGSIHVRMLSK